jgi:hypothetical protein
LNATVEVVFSRSAAIEMWRFASWRSKMNYERPKIESKTDVKGLMGWGGGNSGGGGGGGYR